MNLEVGFIGLGEAGYHIAKGLAQEGLSGVKAFDVALALGGEYGKTIEIRVKDADVVLVSSIECLASSCSVIFCAVQARYASEVAAAALPSVRPDSVYVDVTTAQPSQKQALAEQFSAEGHLFVDGAMMGSLPLDGHKVPMLCSGNGAEDLCTLMNGYGMKMQYVPGNAGVASTQKFVRSSFTKGLEALAVELLLFARKMGVEKETLHSLAASMAKTPFDETLIRLVRSDVIHAERRVHEVEDCMALMEECGIMPVMAEATINRLKRTADMNLKTELGGVTPQTPEEVYALWEAKNYR